MQYDNLVNDIRFNLLNKLNEFVVSSKCPKLFEKFELILVKN